MPDQRTPLLTLKSVSKSFGPVKVIDDVTVDVRAGEVEVLLGENGAGKSTLIKMMSGIYQPDTGRILVDGQPVHLPDVKAAEAHGIATIHQELNLVPQLSVAENITLGRTPQRFGVVDKPRMNAVAREALERIGLDVPLAKPVGELGVARQQLVEIAKALSQDARLLILDEPTAALTGREIDALFEVVDDLKRRGVGMVFISHHLDEIPRIGDSISVLRDGQFVAQVPANTSQDNLIALMVGRDIDDQFPRKRPEEQGEPLLEVQGLSSGEAFEDVNFSVHAGEVLGIAGLVGAGRTEVLRAIFGVDPYDSGSVTLQGKALPPHDVGRSIAEGLGLVPEDRKSQGLVLDASVGDNAGLATLRSTSKFGLVDRSGQRSRAQVVTDQLAVRMAGLDQPIRDLSGGNQQKVVFARWVMADAKVLLLDEPTRGVDVGAKVEIYELINEITSLGGAVVMVSSELPEVLGMSDRVLVMSNGRVAGVLDADDATEDSVMALAVSEVTSAVTASEPSTKSAGTPS
ncbi:sugar ABC transporter ATP-binding protein [Kocuria sp. JC486]|uniref:Sugar ABC transporter ATP-binding protein n=1 Tax=Kocuria soli TaxID=2485125 RepID=A0A3N3ZPC2_9MICC|nr:MULTISPECIES: sugar ABC transporter ATP-binding protein [Kocuria]NHU85655.1 sugar ABC transporter ATP-binding protein [Kocuria sp. JC486]ROZ62824.1 sugar ABC transporter ATP-binding protein [Kocuria soli]